MMAVKVTLGPTPVLSDAVKLLDAPYAFGDDRTSINYDVTADGRFVMIREDSDAIESGHELAGRGGAKFEPHAQRLRGPAALSRSRLDSPVGTLLSPRRRT